MVFEGKLLLALKISPSRTVMFYGCGNITFCSAAKTTFRQEYVLSFEIMCFSDVHVPFMYIFIYLQANFNSWVLRVQTIHMKNKAKR